MGVLPTVARFDGEGLREILESWTGCQQTRLPGAWRLGEESGIEIGPIAWGELRALSRKICLDYAWNLGENWERWWVGEVERCITIKISYPQPNAAETSARIRLLQRTEYHGQVEWDLVKELQILWHYYIIDSNKYRYSCFLHSHNQKSIFAINKNI